MNYRTRALLLGLVFLVTGAAVLLYVPTQLGTFTSHEGSLTVQGSIIIFTGLGLLLIGTLTMFAAPQSLVTAEIANRAITAASHDIVLLLGELPSQIQATHVPVTVLGQESGVTLVFLTEKSEQDPEKKIPRHEKSSAWSHAGKAIEPTGLELMKGFEKVIKRDFLEVETHQLSRSLSRAIVSELQIASAFSLREAASNRFEATWKRPTLKHTCEVTKEHGYPPLCFLCSAIACALAKSTGKPVQIEGSHSIDTESSIVTMYRLVED